jgi:DNA polymerase/3'-5' exonuclease PolX
MNRIAKVISNSEIAEQLAMLAQLLPDLKENFYKKKAYRRAAMKIKTMGESLQDLVQLAFQSGASSIKVTIL